MIQHQGIFLPDGEQHLQGWMSRAGQIVDGRGTYQYRKLEAALSYCKRFRNAVDIGAHVGMWTMQLAKRFAHVHAFEPMIAHRECFALNVTALNVTQHSCAMGAARGTVGMHVNAASSGDTHVDGAGEIEVATLDEFAFDDVDFIKIDVEGFELYVVRGAQETIARCRPVMIVEQKPRRAERYGLGRFDAVEHLRAALDYRVAGEISGDFILTPA